MESPILAAFLGVMLGYFLGWALTRERRRRYRTYRTAGSQLATNGQAHAQLETMRGELLSTQRELARAQERLKDAGKAAEQDRKTLAELRQTLRDRGAKIDDLERQAAEALAPAPAAMPPRRAPAGVTEMNGGGASGKWSPLEIRRAAAALGVEPEQVEAWAELAQEMEPSLRKARA